METRRTSQVLITLLAALTILYPRTAARPGGDQAGTSPANLFRGKGESREEEAKRQGFPTAKDLISEFLISGAGDQATPVDHPPEVGYRLDFLIATVPDPSISRLPRFFDSFAESLERATEAAGYALDRFALPWAEKGNGAQEGVPSWHKELFESQPGLILFRDPQNRKLLLVFLVGETPTTGIHKDAMYSALDQMAQFYPWDPKHAELPPGFPQVAPGSSAAVAGPKGGATFRVMGPAFSGSAVSLRFVLDQWSQSRRTISDLQFRIVSGTATAIDSTWLSKAAQGRTTFQATVPPDDETLQAVGCYIGNLGYQKAAILTEGNTAYGQNFTRQVSPGAGTPAPSRGSCRNGQRPPQILSLPFPMLISRLRSATGKATPQPDQSGTGKESGKPASSPLPEEKAGQPREVLPSFSDLSVKAADLMLSNLLSTISRERYTYVGIVATDVRDITFLAREVREHCPATVLFTLNSDLLFADPGVNDVTRGMIVVTPYPLFNLEQLWAYPYRGEETRLQFSSQAAEGVYNATLALLHEDDKLVDYGRPLAVLPGGQGNEGYRPSLWVTAIGNGEVLPVSLLGWRDERKYMYTPDSTMGAQGPVRKPIVGPGIYAENSVVAIIALSLCVFVFSILIVGQYRRPWKKVADRISIFLGDTASASYWSECRLFLLCCVAGLLAFYLLAAGGFCLPLMAARELGSRVQSTATPKIAIGIALVTLLSLILAGHTLTAALRAAPSELRGSAPEVVLFSLFGCLLFTILGVLLSISWIVAVKTYPASGLFTYLRAIDVRGGLSPLLPLACVTMGGCLWAYCSYRRLRLVDVLRATGSLEKAQSWLNFLALEVRSFNGVRELENNLKHILESSSVISLRGYAVLAALALMVGHYFFATRLVRALEPQSFYWLFEAAFIIIYWALLMEFLRLAFAWRSLHMLLQRLSWHPLIGACKRYREFRPNFVKMNLTQPPSSFAALEASVGQANRVLRTARALAAAEDTEAALRELLQQSIPEWEAHRQAAEAQLCEALQLQWADNSEVVSHPRPATARRKRGSHIKGDWRQTLVCRHNAHQALFQLLQALAKPLEHYWFSGRAEGVPTASKEFFKQAEEFTVTRIVNFLAIVFPVLQNLGGFVLAGLLLMLLAVTSYPFQPRNEFLFFNWVVILCFIGTAFWILVEMDRDTVLSLLNGTVPGQINFSRELVIRTLLYVAVPLFALLGAQFPQSLQQVLSLFTGPQAAP